MSQYYPENARVLRVERAGALDRYGVPQTEVVVSYVSGFMDKHTQRFMNPNGSTVQIDATISLGCELLAEDNITLDDKFQSKWKVFSVNEVIDVIGNVIYWEYNLIKQRGSDAAD